MFVGESNWCVRRFEYANVSMCKRVICVDTVMYGWVCMSVYVTVEDETSVRMHVCDCICKGVLVSGYG